MPTFKQKVRVKVSEAEEGQKKKIHIEITVPGEALSLSELLVKEGAISPLSKSLKQLIGSEVERFSAEGKSLIRGIAERNAKREECSER